MLMHLINEKSDQIKSNHSFVWSTQDQDRMISCIRPRVVPDSSFTPKLLQVGFGLY
jgi:hypothetical protein